MSFSFSPLVFSPSPSLIAFKKLLWPLHMALGHYCSLMMLSEALSGVWTVPDPGQEPMYSTGCSHHGYSKTWLGSTHDGPQPARPPQPPPIHSQRPKSLSPPPLGSSVPHTTAWPTNTVYTHPHASTVCVLQHTLFWQQHTWIQTH